MASPSTINLSTFDFTFDHTFQLKITLGPIASNPCHIRGIHLMWESPTGWTSWTFSGKAITDAVPSAIGTYQKAGIDMDTQRISQEQMIIRAGSLSKADAKVISSVLKSVKVYCMAPDADGFEQVVRVYVEPASVTIWNDAEGLAKIEARIRFPFTKSQRG